MFKIQFIAYASVIAAAAAGGQFVAHEARQFNDAQMALCQAACTPQALNAPDYAQRVDAARASLQAVADGGQSWAAQQEAQAQR